MHLTSFLPRAFAAAYLLHSFGVEAKPMEKGKTSVRVVNLAYCLVLNHCDVKTTPHTPQFFLEHGSQRITTSYGVQTLPSAHNHGGMLELEQRIPPPCSDCLITFMQAGLEYLNGTVPDADKGVWLHHTIFSTLNKRNTMCSYKHGDWFFASGNERTPVDLCASGESKTGYYIGTKDRMAVNLDLMNMNILPQEVIFTMTWEYIPGLPSDFEQLTPYWLDIGGCGSSSFPSKPSTAFSYSSQTWKSDFFGRIVTIVGHLHDGGTHLEIKKNSEIVCDAEAHYHDSTTHIARISTCTDVGMTQPKDKWSITAYYNTSEHPPMRTHMGKLEPVMGIAMAYVAQAGGSHKHHHYHHHKSHWFPICIGLIVFSLVLYGAFMRMTRAEQSWKSPFSARRRNYDLLPGGEIVNERARESLLDVKYVYTDDE